MNIGVAAPMAYFPFSGWKDSFLGVLHGQGRDGGRVLHRQESRHRALAERVVAQVLTEIKRWTSVLGAVAAPIASDGNFLSSRAS